ncbi:MAG: hypothetical protein ABFS19_09205 [Thermodesulfobacteriota bacterium]
MDQHYLGYHEILIDGSDYESCCRRVESFFNSSELVRYDHIVIDEKSSISAADEDFRQRIDSGLTENRQVVNKLIRELSDEGFGELSDWEYMEQGYLSKTVHTLAHLLDGFIGIDSVFYNCLEDSHTLSAVLRARIEKNPANYYLIRVEGFAADRSRADQLPLLRKQF